MAGNQERDGVGRACAGHCACGRGPADCGRDLLVAAGFAVRDRLELAPDAPLEGRGAHVERQIDVWRSAAQVLQERPHLCAQDAIVRPHDRIGEFRAQILFERAIAVTNHDPAHAARRGGKEQPSQR